MPKEGFDIFDFVLRSKGLFGEELHFYVGIYFEATSTQTNLSSPQTGHGRERNNFKRKNNVTKKRLTSINTKTWSRYPTKLYGLRSLIHSTIPFFLFTPAHN
jgi:hypothetical protein